MFTVTYGIIHLLNLKIQELFNMTTEQMVQKYKDWIFRQSAYQMALSLINFDKLTIAPEGGNAYRDEREAYLSGEYFAIATEKDMIPVLKALRDDENADADTRRACELYYKDMMKEACIPKEEFVAWRTLQNESYNHWLEAKQKNDYSIFEPYLKKIIEGSKKIYGFRNSDVPLYDQMLDDFEPGMDREKYDHFFNALKERILPLIKKVTEAEQIEDGFLYEKYDIEGQKAFMEHLLKYLEYTPDWGYQNETEHPFTDWVCENDCRTTRKYLENNVVSAIFSTIHECGHAWYEHNIDPKYDGMILSNGVSSGMHESESRLCENYLGRTRAFWEANYPALQEQFREQLGDVTIDEFISAVNVARPSLIRTEADELTYPVHIMIRYELEKGIFEGTISTDHLDEAWNAKYKEYLGVEVKDAKDGILQDVHWADGSFGYFPTYALGSAFAAQFVHQMRSEIDVDGLLRTGKYGGIQKWLREKFQHYGCFYDAPEIMKIVSGKEFDPRYYIEYLEDKYCTLYHLDADI